MTLAEARRRAGWSQAELARRLGVSRQAVSAWEAGQQPRPAHTEALVQLLGDDLELPEYERSPSWGTLERATEGAPRELRRARLAAGLTQAEAAERIGVSASSLIYWERGECRPQPLARRAIEAALGVPADAWSAP